LVLRDGSPQLSAPWIARFAHQQLRDTKSVAVLAMNKGATLDDALSDAGYPRLGFSDTSFWRPVFQVLPLSLELLWRPLDPVVLLQFLAHPMGPIPGPIRRRLAEVVASEPGIGGDSWLAAVESALDKAVADEPEQTAKEKRNKLAANVDFWLDSERFDPQSGVPLPVLKTRIQRISAWLSSAFAVQEDEAVAKLYSAALGQSDELNRTIDRLMKSGNDQLTRESTRHLVEAVRGTGVSRPGRPWQCEPGTSQLLKADSPAGVIEPVSTVIWWGCDKERLPGLYPWSRSEQATLAAHGIKLLPLDTQLEWQAGTWLRPILSAKERLVLVLHDSVDSHHPVFDQIVAVAEGWLEARVDEVMREPTMLPLDCRLPEVQMVSQQAIPAKTRWWQLPDSVSLGVRDVESYSSLEKFLYGPYQWVLNYKARVRPGALAELGDGSLLKGSLAHDLFERFFREHEDIGSINAARAEQWAVLCLNDLIEKCGAVLLTPGRQAEKEDFIVTVTRALSELVMHLQSANVVQVSMEASYQGRFRGGEMQGMIDMHVTNASGATAVVDIKWGGLEYRRNTLKQSTYLQLAVYAQLSHQKEQQWPALGNFIIRDAQMLVLESDFFPNAAIEKTTNGESLLEFWQRVETTWQWRRAQLDLGLVEVTITDTEPDETSSPGEFGLPMPETFDKFDDYTVLTGWSAES
jgi:ATP-dependent helicase/nuclease subunit B